MQGPDVATPGTLRALALVAFSVFVQALAMPWLIRRMDVRPDPETVH